MYRNENHTVRDNDDYQQNNLIFQKKDQKTVLNKNVKLMHSDFNM